jgi:hypothetical protein
MQILYKLVFLIILVGKHDCLLPGIKWPLVVNVSGLLY